MTPRVPNCPNQPCLEATQPFAFVVSDTNQKVLRLHASTHPKAISHEDYFGRLTSMTIRTQHVQGQATATLCKVEGRDI